jgi:hypothetical protein
MAVDFAYGVARNNQTQLNCVAPWAALVIAVAVMKPNSSIDCIPIGC